MKFSFIHSIGISTSTFFFVAKKIQQVTSTILQMKKVVQFSFYFALYLCNIPEFSRKVNMHTQSLLVYNIRSLLA